MEPNVLPFFLIASVISSFFLGIPSIIAYLRKKTDRRRLLNINIFLLILFLSFFFYYIFNSYYEFPKFLFSIVAGLVTPWF